MTEVERVSAQIHAMWADDSDETWQKIVQDIARWHLAAVRKARGKTLGYVRITQVRYGKIVSSLSPWRTPTDNARVVAEPEKRRAIRAGGGE